MTRALPLAALTAMVALVWPQAAPAVAVSQSQFSALAQRAAGGDENALRDLSAVTTVGGRAMAPAAALSGNPADVRRRLLTLVAEEPTSGAPNPQAARRAASILQAQGFRGPSGTVGTSGRGGGGLNWIWIALAAVVLVVTAIVARFSLGRLEPAERQAGAAGDGTRAASRTPPSLEQEAADAEARGAFAEAVRLRFRAGVLTLAARAVIERRTSLRTAEISRRLASAEFDSLAARFEQIAYGGTPASAQDARQAREGWERILAGASQ